MEAIDRIETVLEQREQTPYALCKFLGINQSSYSTWKARNTLPPAKYIADIARFLHVSTDYILTGKESAYTDVQTETYTDDEKELLSIYKALPTEKRYEFKGEMKGYLKALEESKNTLTMKKDYPFRLVSSFQMIPDRRAYGFKEILFPGLDRRTTELRCCGSTALSLFLLFFSGGRACIAVCRNN